MKSRLEQFVRDHREEFDADEPGKKIWEKIEFQLEPAKKKPASVVRMMRVRWSVAAAVILLLAGGVWYFTNVISQKSPQMATNNLPKAATPDANTPKDPPATKGQDEPATQPIAREHPPLAATTERTPEESPEAIYKEEMGHYARLVELKHKELKTIEKDEPLLYKQFAHDVNKLDSVYRTLEKELPQNPNREQLLEAMLQNLQLQMGLLNHQLDIIKKINHSKKTAYEKAYNSL